MTHSTEATALLQGAQDRIPGVRIDRDIFPIVPLLVAVGPPIDRSERGVWTRLQMQVLDVQAADGADPASRAVRDPEKLREPRLSSEARGGGSRKAPVCSRGSAVRAFGQ